LEPRVAATAGAAARDRDLLARPHEGESRAVPAPDLRARRHRAHERAAPAPSPGEPSPWPPRSARKGARRRNASRSRSESSQRSTTSPPRPPSPPSGPALGTGASRRNERLASPPAPARTSRWARSFSMGNVAEGERADGAARLAGEIRLY